MSSGEFKGWNKMFKYVPPAWILGKYNPGYKSYAQYIREALQKSEGEYGKYMDDIIANNAFDSKLVKKVPYKNSDDTDNFIDYNTIIKIGKPIDKHSNAERYILVRDGEGYNISDYNLYKLIDYAQYGEDEYAPVYARIKKKGYSTSGYDVYEYGWDFNYGENENAAMVKFDVDEAVARATAFIGTELSFVAQDEDRLARAVADVYLGKIDPETPSGDTAPQAPQSTRTVEPGAHIATRGYKKGDPQKHPEFNYVFTENAQAYLTSQLVNSDEESKRFADPNTELKKDSDIPSSLFAEVNPTPYVKLNVSDVNGTN